MKISVSTPRSNAHKVNITVPQRTLIRDIF